MMVTALERTRGRRGRVDVYVDGVRLFEVSRDMAKKRELRPGAPLAAEDVEAIVAADQRRQALDTAVGMLARRPRSEREVRRKLAQRRCPPEIAEETVRRLYELNLIDDSEFARSWVESREHASPRGRRLLVQELRTLGVDAPVARDAAAAVDETEAAYVAACRRLRSLHSADQREFKQRLGGYLQRRGFGWSVVSATVDRCWSEAGAQSGDDAPEAIG